MLITILSLLALNPEWQIRTKQRLVPKRPDGSPVEIGFS